MNRNSLYALFPGVQRRLPARSESAALYLTFDDGPDPDVTPRVLDALERYGARATFFVIGEKALRYRAIVEEIALRGHRLGNHSFSHAGFRELSLAEQLREIRRTDEVLDVFENRRRHPFRPPHGYASLSLLFAMRQRMVLWSIDSRDYARDGSSSIARLEQSKATDGDIVLMHDDHDTVLEVLPVLLPKWAAARFSHPVIG